MNSYFPARRAADAFLFIISEEPDGIDSRITHIIFIRDVTYSYSSRRPQNSALFLRYVHLYSDLRGIIVTSVQLLALTPSSFPWAASLGPASRLLLQVFRYQHDQEPDYDEHRAADLVIAENCAAENQVDDCWYSKGLKKRL